ncbi:MAG: 1-deoxy-D-xylulose-5-phosphate reductoisomerase [Leadbetterella sp.]
MKKNIAILGSTGSIGTQALEVIADNREMFDVEVLTAQSNADLLIEQAVQFQPNCVVIGDENLYERVASSLSPHPIKVYSGESALASVVENENIHIVLTALVGYAGLIPTVNAIKSGKTIALANKETLVVAGDIITQLAIKHNVDIIPVDSEHSAIFQCLVGEYMNPIEKIILTASGGPFRGKSKEELANVTKQQALKHPNWDMGAKITIDSASLMNKGLEVIEAKWLFDLSPEQIEVVVHPQSIIHSLVQFEDGSIKAQLGLPDMKLPIQYAFGFPKRLKSTFPRFDFDNFSKFDFEKPDNQTFRNLDLAFSALRKKGNMACILNAANEIAVAAFLNDHIGFLQISDIIEKTMNKAHFVLTPTLEDYIDTNKDARQIAQSFIKK